MSTNLDLIIFLSQKRKMPTVIETFTINADIIDQLKKKKLHLEDRLKMKEGIVKIQAASIKNLRAQLEKITSDNGVDLIKNEIQCGFIDLRTKICDVINTNLNEYRSENAIEPKKKYLTGVDFPPLDRATNKVRLVKKIAIYEFFVVKFQNTKILYSYLKVYGIL